MIHCVVPPLGESASGESMLISCVFKTEDGGY